MANKKKIGDKVRTQDGQWWLVTDFDDKGTPILGRKTKAPADAPTYPRKKRIEFDENEIMWLIMLIQNLPEEEGSKVREGTVGYSTFGKLQKSNNELKKAK